MELISKLIEIALDQLFECAVINWIPGEESQPETFEAECEIEQAYGRDSDFFITMCDVLCIVDAATMTCWHASRIDKQER